MAKPYIAFGLPSYDGKVVTDFSSSYAHTVSQLSSMGIRMREYKMDGCCYIDRARDDICHMFLKDKEPTHLLFIDSDMGWDKLDVVKLLRHDKDIVCGAYCMKDPDPIFPVRLLKQAEMDGGLLRVEAAPTGFMMISRKALEAYKKKYPELIHDGIGHMKGQKVMAFFDRLIIGSRIYREDIAFGLRWTRMGGKLWVDPTIQLRHWSGTQCFQHNFHEYLKDHTFKEVA